jgi:hypothetical protein
MHVVLCLDASQAVQEPLAGLDEVQRELVPFVLSHAVESLSNVFSKQARQSKVRELTNAVLSGQGEIATAFHDHLVASYGSPSILLRGALKALEPDLREHSVDVVRFVHSAPGLSSVGVPPSVQSFKSGEFTAKAAEEWWHSDGPSAGIWPSLLEVLRGRDWQDTRVLTVTAPWQVDDAVVSLACSAISLCWSSLVVGVASSEALERLEELAACSGGLSLQISDSVDIELVVASLRQHVFCGTDHIAERRDYYAARREQKWARLFLPSQPSDLEGALRHAVAAREGKVDLQLPTVAMMAPLCDTEFSAEHRWARGLRFWRALRGLRDVTFGDPGPSSSIKRSVWPE